MSDRSPLPTEESDSTLRGRPTPLHLLSGPNKRSLSIFSDIVGSEPKKFREEMDCDEDEEYSGDELDDQLLDEMDDPISPVSPSSAPPSNFIARVAPRPVPGAKKLQIKNFRTPTTVSGCLAEEWKALEEAVVAIHSAVRVKHTFEQLYKMVTNVCSPEKSGEMYNKLLELSRTAVAHDRDLLASNRDIPATEFLRSLSDLWANFCEKMMMIRNLFIFLDRTYVLNRPSMQSIWDASLTTFSEVIMDNSYVRERCIADILALFAEERAGNQVDRGLLRCLLRMLSSLHIYEQIFERPFLEATRELYGNEGATLSRDLEISEYLKYVHRRLDEESERVEICLHDSTRKPLIHTVETQFIAEHMHSFVSRGLDSLLSDDKIEDLSLLYTLLWRVSEGPALLRSQFVEYIKKHGKAIVMDKERDKDMVQDLMKFKDKMDRIVRECFEDSEKFQQSEKDSFDYFVNTRPNKPAELIAKYVDSRLRAGNKEASDEELDSMMDKLIVLFRFIHGKDVFEAYYKKDLAKRLLLSRSASVDAEKAMLSKLKHECGAGFTQNLETMFKDMEISKELAIGFKQYVDHTPGKELPMRGEFSVAVLTMGQWPNYEYQEATLPPEMKISMEIYESCYVSRHSSRKLTWQHSLGSCLLKGTFRPGCSKELQVSLYQTLVLLLFNEKESWSYEEIAEATKIKKDDLNRTLQSLACAKLKVLTKTPKGRDVAAGDTFEVNTHLNEKLYRIKVSQVQQKETAEEHAATEEQVNQDRQYQVDAAIVRIMKTRKTLPHTALIQELFGQLRFPVNSSDLKTRIASLMERDYVSRDSSDPNTYHYVS